MLYRSVNMIFETSGQPVPSDEDVLFEAKEIVQQSGWGVPLIERLKKIADPYWREAITRKLLERWREHVRDKDEMTYYYDMDGFMCYCWTEAEDDFGRIIRRCTAEQVEAEHARQERPPVATPVSPAPEKKKAPQIVFNLHIHTNNAPIFTDSNVNIY